MPGIVCFGIKPGLLGWITLIFFTCSPFLFEDGFGFFGSFGFLAPLFFFGSVDAFGSFGILGFLVALVLKLKSLILFSCEACSFLGVPL